MKNQPSSIKQFSQFFQVPILTIYLTFVAIVVFVGIFVSSGAMQQPQRTETKADSAQAQIVQCNQACSHNHQCPPNHFCFNGLCRLVTNPHSPTCDTADTTKDTAPPTSPTTPATPAPTVAPTTQPTLKSCDEPCTNNNQCQANHFCYQGNCRLLSDAQDPLCGQSSAPGASSSGTQPTQSAQPTQPIQPTLPATPAVTGITKTEPPFSPFVSEEETKTEPGIMGVINEFLADSDTSIFFVLGIGLVGLILLVAIITFLNSRKKIEYKPADFSGLEKTPQSNQENNQTIPINPSATTASTHSETQPTYSNVETDNNTKAENNVEAENPTNLNVNHENNASMNAEEANQTADLSMISRLKEKNIEMPQEKTDHNQTTD